MKPSDWIIEPGTPEHAGYQHLAIELRDYAGQILDLIHDLEDLDEDDFNRKALVLRNGTTLIRVLANVAAGKPLLKAMGAPGDWGYDTPLGQALLAALRESDLHASAPSSTQGH